MVWDRRNHPLWIRCVVATLVAILAAVVRRGFLAVLGLFVPFLTFYPAVAIAAFYGGLPTGSIATGISAAFADYFWIAPVGRFFPKNTPDLIGILVFLATGVLISWFAEAAFRAHERTREAVEEQARFLAERQRAEERLREQRERFKVTLASIGDGVLSTDNEGKVTFINPVAAALTGWSIEKALGQPIREIFRVIDEKSRVPAEDIVERVLQEGAAVALANHTVLVTPEGRDIPIEDSAAPIKGSRGEVSGVVLVFHDVTEKRRAAEALQESEERLRLFIEHAPASLAMFDREMRYLSCSRRWASDYNLLDRAVTGLSHYEVFPEIGGEWKEIYRRALAGEVLKVEEDRFERMDGSVQWLRWEVRPWRDSKGDVGGIVIFTEDITERRRMEEETRKARDELEQRVAERTAEIRSFVKKLEQSNQALQDFASIASHDLQEPLRKVGTFAGMLRQKCGEVLGEQGNSYLDKVLDANGRMQSLLAGLLEYSRVTTRADAFTEVDLSEIVRQVVSDLEVRIRNTGGEVHIGELPTVHADPTQMRQLFQNLIGNGLKFHREGVVPIVRVQSAMVDGDLHVAVEDNGIGFEERYSDRIFAPFQRLHGRSSRFKGTGMGLAICRKIVERHGGAITVTSTPGAGAKFSVRLPGAKTRQTLENSYARG